MQCSAVCVLLSSCPRQQIIINSNKRPMSVHPTHSKLPHVLSSLFLRRAAFFMRSLILVDQEWEELRPVKSYDQQCEGAHILLSFFKNKLQSIKFKAFITLQEGREEEQPTVVVNDTKPGNGTTRRTYLNSTLTHEDLSPARPTPNATIISEREFSTDEIVPTPKPSPPSSRLHRLLNKVKNVNSSSRVGQNYIGRPSAKSQRVESDFNDYRTFQAEEKLQHRFSPTSQINYNRPSPYRSGTSSARDTRRMFILQKFSQLESKLELLEQNGRSQARVGQQIRSDVSSLRERLQQRHNYGGHPLPQPV